jgi:hypothetical protein
MQALSIRLSIYQALINLSRLNQKNTEHPAFSSNVINPVLVLFRFCQMMNRTTCSILQSVLLILEFIEFLTSPQGKFAVLGILVYFYLIAALN